MATAKSVSIDPNVLNEVDAKIKAMNVKYMVASYVDMHGIPKAKIVPVDCLEHMLEGSELFTGAALDGVPQNMSDTEVSAVPDPNSLIKVPWREDCAWFSSDLWLEGQPFEACNRGILKRVLKKAEDMGFIVNCGIEAEFFVLKEDEAGKPVPLSSRTNLDKPAYDAARVLDNLDLWLDKTVQTMNDLGWGVYSFDHEDGIGQFELDFDYTNALEMADRFVFLRVMTQEFARENGAFASWMPKPFPNRAGSGAHYNISLADKETGENLFEIKGQPDPYNLDLSELGYKFVAGIIEHLPAILAVAAPTVNSYKRLLVKGSASGFTWAPTFTSWGNNNRSNTLRVPGGGGRVELRAADSACNPYLGLALTIAAGLEGIEKDMTPQPANKINLFEQSEEYRQQQQIKWLPRSLGEAIEAFESDPFSAEVFGELMAKSWADYKHQEWSDYNAHVTDWEFERYLKQF